MTSRLVILYSKVTHIYHTPLSPYKFDNNSQNFLLSYFLNIQRKKIKLKRIFKGALDFQIILIRNDEVSTKTNYKQYVLMGKEFFSAIF